MKEEAGRILDNGKPDRRTKLRCAPKKKVGSEKKPIDWAKVDELLLAGCTAEEISSYFGVSSHQFCVRTREQHGMYFSDYRHKMKQKGESILRFQQYAKALGISKEGDNTLLIWLGKQRLGQLETPQEATVGEQALKNFGDLMEQISKFHEKKE
jgi:hypothetical protein